MLKKLRKYCDRVGASSKKNCKDLPAMKLRITVGLLVLNNADSSGNENKFSQLP